MVASSRTNANVRNRRTSTNFASNPNQCGPRLLSADESGGVVTLVFDQYIVLSGDTPVVWYFRGSAWSIAPVTGVVVNTPLSCELVTEAGFAFLDDDLITIQPGTGIRGVDGGCAFGAAIAVLA